MVERFRPFCVDFPLKMAPKGQFRPPWEPLLQNKSSNYGSSIDKNNMKMKESSWTNLWPPYIWPHPASPEIDFSTPRGLLAPLLKKPCSRVRENAFKFNKCKSGIYFCLWHMALRHILSPRNFSQTCLVSRNKIKVESLLEYILRPLA